ncbi:hypothetical protein HPB51_028968 [Rhipicephalus microplus]|uniref:Uncharacterized protein n=1 Tax=Rhipicephalus microplus TaxID=6941 RepID=A0A9J6CW08_RHIMP|nr:hypothetical protein HPB51_028968 [Rhipicephalus microplus]
MVRRDERSWPASCGDKPVELGSVVKNGMCFRNSLELYSPHGPGGEPGGTWRTSAPDIRAPWKQLVFPVHCLAAGVLLCQRVLVKPTSINCCSQTGSLSTCAPPGGDLAGLRRLLLAALEGISFLSDEVSQLREENERLHKDHSRGVEQQARVVASLLREELTRRTAAVAVTAPVIPPDQVNVDQSVTSKQPVYSAQPLSKILSSSNSPQAYADTSEEDVLDVPWYFHDKKCVTSSFPQGTCLSVGHRGVYRSWEECRRRCVLNAESQCDETPAAETGSPRQLRHPYFADMQALGGARCVNVTRRELKSHRCLIGSNQFDSLNGCGQDCVRS